MPRQPTLRLSPVRHRRVSALIQYISRFAFNSPHAAPLHRHILILRLKIINKRWLTTRQGLPLILRLKIINSLWLATIQPIQIRPLRAQVGPVTSVVPALPAWSILTDQQPPWTSLVAFRANVVMQEPSMDVDGRVTERYLINVEVLETDPPAVSDTKARTNETRTTLRDIIARFRVADNGLAGHHFAAPYIPNESLPAFLNMYYPTRDTFEQVTLTVADSMARAQSTNAGFGADIFRIRKMLLAALEAKRQIPDGGVILVTYMFQNGYAPGSFASCHLVNLIQDGSNSVQRCHHGSRACAAFFCAECVRLGTRQRG
ncbi:hypothetical protein BCR44DRAFT_1009709 [Catenaria anguillulae PL171]|uniref:Uncharacterized protein n=1 Tax=Catenaria anguillulae PL171 TaxID=765915 RepID=A0A1Y2I3X7_9FUNG|nr:hypothetical protein BCR44DRAFT_1009709 [Catenaria anguillulae PL171]